MTFTGHPTDPSGDAIWWSKKQEEKPESFNNLDQPVSFGTSSTVQFTAPAFVPGSNLSGPGGSVNTSGPFITPGPGAAPGSEEAATEAQIEDAWNALTERAFAVPADELDFPGNWWPGLGHEHAPMSHMIAENAGWFMPGEDRPESWAVAPSTVDFNDPFTGEEDSVWVRYDPSRGAQQFAAMDASERAEYNTMMAKVGMIPEGYEGMADYSLEGANAFTGALQMANYYGISVKQFLTRQVRLAEAGDSGGGRGRGGGRGPQVKLEVPDYDTLLVDAENLLEQKVGRRVDDWEYAIIADHMQDKYGEWAAAKKRAALGGSGTYEIPDPGKLTEGFVEDRYASEISRLDDVGETRQTNSLLIDAATKGLQMVGGLGG